MTAIANKDPVSGAVVPAPMMPFVEALGLEGAVRLSLSLGCSRINILVAPDAGKELVKLAGIEAAEQLSLLMGGERVYVPFCRRFLIRYHQARGMKVPEIARQLKCSETYVYQALRADRERLESKAG